MELPSLSEMMPLYFICETHRIVWTYAPIAEQKWRFSRLSPCQHGKNVFVLLYKAKEDLGWAIQNQTAGKDNDIIGTPSLPKDQHDMRQPPLGRWKIWGNPYKLVQDTPREPPPLTSHSNLDLPFGILDYTEEGNIAKIHVVMKSAAITDEDLETSMGWWSRILRNLAQRHTMCLLIRSDTRESAIPAVRHIRRFLAFMQEMGPEIVLCGRGSVYILQASGILGSAKLAVIRWVQQRLPAPWPEDIVGSLGQADAFLSNIEQECRLVDDESAPSPVVALQEPSPAEVATADRANSSPNDNAGSDKVTGEVQPEAAAHIVEPPPVAVATFAHAGAERSLDGHTENGQLTIEDVTSNSQWIDVNDKGVKGDIIDSGQVEPKGSSSWFAFCRCAETKIQ